MNRPAWAGPAAAVLAPAAVLLVLAQAVGARTSVTYDETFYLTAAKVVFGRGAFDACAQNGVAPLPVVLKYGPTVWARGDRISPFIWEPTPDDPESIALARATATAVVGLPLVVLAAAGAYRRTRSAAAALGAGLLVALSPTFVAHAALATTDACFTLFFLTALVAIGRHAAVPTAGRFAATGVLIGLAAASKYTGLVLLPIGFLVGAAADGRIGPVPTLTRRLARMATVHPARQLGLGAVAGLVAWATTGFELSPTPLSARPAAGVPAGTGVRRVLGDGPVADAVIDFAHRVRLPSPVVGVYRQFAMASDGGRPLFPTHLFGRLYPAGHRLYYACAVLLKSTPAELVLLVLAAVGAGSLAGRGGPDGLPGLAVAVGLGVLFVLFSLSAKQFGVRYLLPLFPVAAVAGVTTLFNRLACRPVLARVILGGLVGWQAVSAACSFPVWLSYTNDLSLATGPAHECLGNSDVDWGQGLVALGQFQAREGEPVVLARLLGKTPPAVYGVGVLPWRAYPCPPCRYIAVGAAVLYRDPGRDPRVRPFRGLRPAAVVGGSILIYDAHDTAVWRAFEQGLADYRAPAADGP